MEDGFLRNSGVATRLSAWRKDLSLRGLMGANGEDGNEGEGKEEKKKNGNQTNGNSSSSSSENESSGLFYSTSLPDSASQM